LQTDSFPKVLDELKYDANYADEQIIKIDQMSSSKTMDGLLEQMNIHNEEFNVVATATYLDYIEQSNLKASGNG